VIANGHLVGVRSTRDWSTFHWRAVDPMATYLAFFAAGRFDVERGRTPSGVPYTLAVSRQLGPLERRQAMALMRRTTVVQTWLEGHLGRFPFGSTGGLTTAHNTRFALENQTRPTYPYVGGPWADTLVAHELAHQWFGDSVSVDAWRDIWLNEGLATYMETWWEHRGPGSAQQMRDWLVNEYYFYSLDNGWRWALPIGDPGPHRLFREEVYDRGAMTVQALRNVLGDEDFGELLRQWVTVHRHGNASIADFQALAESVSGKDLGGFFQVWLYAGTAPDKTPENGLNDA
jgi:aminopeptidase N